MGSGSQRWLAYIFTLATFLFILFALDTFFGLHYNPEDHRLNRKPDATSQITHSEDSKDIEIEKSQPVEEETPALSVNINEGDDFSAYFDRLTTSYQQKVSDIPEGKTRTDIIIRYYHHNPDGDAAYALEKLKFYIHERPVDAAVQDYQSNAIYYGDNVTNEDIKVVAYTLLEAGIPIKSIRSTSYEWKSNSIEIGTDTSMLSLPTLTLEDIKNFSK